VIRSLRKSGDGSDRKGKVALLCSEETSHHNTHPLHIGRVKRRRIFLQLATVSRIETLERDKDISIPCLAGNSLWRKLEIGLIGDSSLLASIFRVDWQELVLEDEGISLFVAFRDLQLDTCVLGKIPLPVVARGALAGESGPAESLDVEIAVEASDSFIVGIEIRL